MMEVMIAGLRAAGWHRSAHNTAGFDSTRQAKIRQAVMHKIIPARDIHNEDFPSEKKYRLPNDDISGLGELLNGFLEPRGGVRVRVKQAGVDGRDEVDLA